MDTIVTKFNVRTKIVKYYITCEKNKNIKSKTNGHENYVFLNTIAL